MIPSAHNIISKIKGSENHYIINLLSGNADILDANKARQILSNEIDDLGEWVEKGYIINKEEEQKLYRKKYLEFVDSRETDEVQIFFSPTYTCNFTCSYCFQDEYSVVSNPLNTDIVDAFFRYIDIEFANRRKYITLFGGEPLLPNPRHRQLISYFLEQCNLRNLAVAVVTNGYSISEYLPELKKASIREIQVTLDGIKEMHDKRRRLKNQKGTFDTIVEGINILLENKIPVNLRMVVDKENIDDLPLLARFAIEQGWTRHSHFKTQIGRNYELHHCQLDRSRLFSRVELYEKIYELILAHPEIIEFHKPAFSVSKFLFENGELPAPLFDSCPGTKTEWAFDYSGKIYACTATVGKDDEALGTFYPQIEKYDDIIEMWQDRDVMGIAKCKGCSLQLACGGGCAAVAKNRNGSVLSADCRPVNELLSLGVSYYFEKYYMKEENPIMSL
jgi:uncharacterized protein